MSKKNKRIYLILFGVALALFFGVRFGLQYASIGASYDAKIVCSCMFISGRDFRSIQSEDLYTIPFAHIEVDTLHKLVTADIYGLAKSQAIYRPGLGCTLLNEVTSKELLEQSPPAHTTAPEDSFYNYESFPANIDSIRLRKVLDTAFMELDSTVVKRTRAIVLLYQGKPIVEQYAPGITAQTPLMGWSMTKSVTNAMVGILVKDGKLTAADPAPVEEWKNDARQKITLDHLLRMSSGLDFVEDYSTPSDATKMLFREKGAGAYALQSKLKSTPGTKWYYSSGTTNILQEIMRRQFPSLEAYQAFPYVRLFDKIGMNSAVLEPDASGTFVGSSYMYATARDWARFGQLYLQDGLWQGEQILPQGWVQYSSTETPHSQGTYAAQFWINHQDPEFPQDAFYADGFEGQYVVIIPSKKMVIVRLGCTQGDGFDITTFVKDVLKTIH